MHKLAPKPPQIVGGAGTPWVPLSRTVKGIINYQYPHRAAERPLEQRRTSGGIGHGKEPEPAALEGSSLQRGRSRMPPAPQSPNNRLENYLFLGYSSDRK
jgi:hypothetical protein